MKEPSLGTVGGGLKASSSSLVRRSTRSTALKSLSARVDFRFPIRQCGDTNLQNLRRPFGALGYVTVDEQHEFAPFGDESVRNGNP